MRRPDAGSFVGVLLFIMVVAASTAAVMMYKRLDAQTVLMWSVIALAVLFVIALFFTGAKIPTPKPVKALYWRTRYRRLIVAGIV